MTTTGPGGGEEIMKYRIRNKTTGKYYRGMTVFGPRFAGPISLSRIFNKKEDAEILVSNWKEIDVPCVVVPIKKKKEIIYLESNGWKETL